MLDKNKTFEEHTCTVDKLAKNIGLIDRIKPVLQGKSLKSIYFAYIHSYLNSTNISLVSTYRPKLKTIHFHQKQAACIVFDEDKLKPRTHFCHRSIH